MAQAQGRLDEHQVQPLRRGGHHFRDQIRVPGVRLHGGVLRGHLVHVDFVRCWRSLGSTRRRAPAPGRRPACRT